MADIRKEQERDELHRAIWAIADELRGAVDGWDFKNYVLGTMFYRYISENLCNYINAGEIEAGNADFDYAKLSDEEAEEAREGLVQEKGFFILPSELFCNVRARAAGDENLNETLETVFRHIEGSAQGSESEGSFAGLFDDYDVNSNKLGATVAKRNEKLVKLLNGVADMKLGDVKDHQIDAFGDAYEYLMTMYASNAGKSGGDTGGKGVHCGGDDAGPRPQQDHADRYSQHHADTANYGSGQHIGIGRGRKASGQTGIDPFKHRKYRKDQHRQHPAHHQQQHHRIYKAAAKPLMEPALPVIVVGQPLQRLIQPPGHFSHSEHPKGIGRKYTGGLCCVRKATALLHGISHGSRSLLQCGVSPISRKQPGSPAEGNARPKHHCNAAAEGAQLLLCKILIRHVALLNMYSAWYIPNRP